MIETIEERLARRKTEYDNLVLTEHKAQRVLDELGAGILVHKEDSLTVYEESAYLYLYPSDIEDAELNVIPRIAELLQEKWNKVVEVGSVTYRIHKYESGFSFSVCVTPRIEGTCRIVAKATGKVVRKHKYVDVEEAEVEYFVDCGEEEKEQ
jgi:hypothetical protein